MLTGKRLLGIDYGSKRIGIAISDPTRIIARGLTTLENDANVFQELHRLIEEHGIECVIVGLPLNLKGEKGQKTKEVEVFISELEKYTPVTIIRWDERFTTSIAQRTMREMGVKKTKRQKKQFIDQMASALILQSYLDAKNVEVIRGSSNEFS